jgi:hypothetical protein
METGSFSFFFILLFLLVLGGGYAVREREG